MRKRRLLLGAGALALLVLVGFLAFRHAFSPTPGVTQANIERLHHGMTEREVEALFGGPGEYWAAIPVTKIGTRVEGKELLTARVGERVPKFWKGDKVDVIVHFDDEGIVWNACLLHHYKGYSMTGELQPVSFWNRLRRLLPW